MACSSKEFNPKHICEDSPFQNRHDISCVNTFQYIQVHHATLVMVGSRFRPKVKTAHAQPTSLLKGETKSGGPSGTSWQHTFSSHGQKIAPLLHKNCNSRAQSASTTEMQRADSRLSSILLSAFSAAVEFPETHVFMYALIRMLSETDVKSKANNPTVFFQCHLACHQSHLPTGSFGGMILCKAGASLKRAKTQNEKRTKRRNESSETSPGYSHG